MAQSQKQNELQYFSRFCSILSWLGLDAPMCGVVVVQGYRLSPLFRLQGAQHQPEQSSRQVPAPEHQQLATTGVPCRAPAPEQSQQAEQRILQGACLGTSPFTCLPNAPALGHSLLGHRYAKTKGDIILKS